MQKSANIWMLRHYIQDFLALLARLQRTNPYPNGDSPRYFPHGDSPCYFLHGDSPRRRALNWESRHFGGTSLGDAAKMAVFPVRFCPQFCENVKE